ncbi:amidase [Salinigranum halophilum]|uniref:amidase n=1 Tax=Salinigranum halophilum TaxID=2565931 RepID=UPI0010A91DCD|nr:amidase [Salinigranum halophilum]
MSEDFAYTSASVLASRIRRGDLSPVDVVDACLERIEARNEDINAFVTVLGDDARERAREAEAAVRRGEELGPLHGVPIAIKDLFDFKAGVRNTMGSVPFAEFVPEESATYVRRLEEAGAIVLGKTNTPEMGHKGTTDNRLFGPTSTPFDLERNAGGSSGGSAAAVADGLVPIAQGSDGGGSVRIPAAWSGVYGFKATYGRVAQAIRPDAFLSHTPAIHAGPLTRTVEDAALMLDVMTGPDPRDPLSMPEEPHDFRGAVRRGVEGMQVAYSPDFDIFPIDERVRAVVDDAVTAFETAGATVEEISLGLTHDQMELADLWLREIGILYHSAVEGFKDEGLDLLGDHRDELTPEFADLLAETRDQSIVDYKRDEHLRTEVYDALQDVFTVEEYDLLVTPTLAVPPVKNDEDEMGSTVGPAEVNGEPVDPLIGWCLTYPINFTGHPAASIPAGFTDGGLPVGLQLVGDRFDDETVFAASGAFERVRPWHDAYPPR